MKSLISVVIALLSCVVVLGQCLTNGDFQMFCGTVATNGQGNCPSWDYPCLGNWTRCQGSPQLLPPNAFANNHVLIWSQGSGNTEGMYSAFPFDPHTDYKIKLRFASPNPSDGKLVIRATNTLSQNVIPQQCGDPVPSPSSLMTIQELIPTTTDWQEYNFTYNPGNSTYSKIWIYAFKTDGAIEQFNVYLDYIYVCPQTCDITKIFNNGNIPPNLTRGQDIFAGSTAGTGGSGTVTVPANVNSILSAAQNVYLKPEFRAVVTGTQTFVAKIEPCEYGSVNTLARQTYSSIGLGTRYRTVSNASETINRDTLANKRIDNLVNVYPTVFKQSLIVSTVESKNTMQVIEVFNLTGRQVTKIACTHSEQQTLNLGYLKPGVYFLRIRTSLGIRTTKIVKK